MASSRKLAIKPPTAAAPIHSPKASSRRSRHDPFRTIEVYANALAPVAGPLLAAISGVAAQIQEATAQLNNERYKDYKIRNDE